MSEFKFFDRGYNNTTLLVPGWAADYRIFDALDLGANYLMPVRFSPFNFNKDLLETMAKHGLGRISVIGWSMGAFAACNFLAEYRDYTNDATLVSMKRKYERDKLEDIRGHLKKNRTAFLCRFYKNCFSKGEEREFAWFKSRLLKNYLDRMGLEILFEGLDYLSENEIRPEVLNGTMIRLVHGQEDRIAPVKEILELKESLPDARLTVISNSGHMPFLKPGFKEAFL